jgi:glycosyltransferase involved in cell wall biosynthesis
LICASTNTFYASVAKKLLKVPLVISLHGETFADSNRLYEKSKFARWSLKTVLLAADRITGCSRIVLQDACSKLGLNLKDATVVPNGVDMPQVDAPEWRRPVARRYILSVGRLVCNKGMDSLIKAFSLVAQKYRDVDVVVAGEGPELPTLQSLSSKHDLNGRIHFVGKIAHADLAPLYENCEFFVCASPIESFGMACLEAMSFGKAVITTNNGGPRDFIDSNEGLLVDTTDITALSKAICDLLEDPARVKSLGEAARKKSISYDWDSVTQQYIDIYKSLARRDSWEPARCE